jgi:hypothetical protein
MGKKQHVKLQAKASVVALGLATLYVSAKAAKASSDTVVVVDAFAGTFAGVLESAFARAYPDAFAGIFLRAFFCGHFFAGIFAGALV